MFRAAASPRFRENLKMAFSSAKYFTQIFWLSCIPNPERPALRRIASTQRSRGQLCEIVNNPLKREPLDYLMHSRRIFSTTSSWIAIFLICGYVASARSSAGCEGISCAVLTPFSKVNQWLDIAHDTLLKTRLACADRCHERPDGRHLRDRV